MRRAARRPGTGCRPVMAQRPLLMRPQARRLPALPAGCVRRSSASACTMSARPMMLFASTPRDRPSTSKLKSAIPSASAVTLPRSPAWRLASSGLEWGCPPGLKCPPALEASGAVQSPFIWTCIPCGPGVRPVMWPATVTVLPRRAAVNVTVPRTSLPRVGSRVTGATGPRTIFCTGAHPGDASSRHARARGSVFIGTSRLRTSQGIATREGRTMVFGIRAARHGRGFARSVRLACPRTREHNSPVSTPRPFQ